MRGVSVEIWVALTALITTTAAVTAFALILEYKRKKLEIAAAIRAKELDADLEKTRLNGYLDLQRKAASDPEHAEAYRQLIEADALHQSVENGTQPRRPDTRASLRNPSARTRSRRAPFCTGPRILPDS